MGERPACVVGIRTRAPEARLPSRCAWLSLAGAGSNPILAEWPTGEFCALLDELGPVGHVVLPCVALEHKAPLKAFTKRYPSASVWGAPGQYGSYQTWIEGLLLTLPCYPTS